MPEVADVISFDKYRGSIQQSGSGPFFELMAEQQSTARASEQQTKSYSKLRELLSELNSVYDDARVANWDMNDAEPVSESTYYNATKLLSTLPLSEMPAPEVIPDNDGYIEFEWSRGDKSFSIYVTDTNLVFFAGYYGKDDRLSGRFKYEGAFPESCKLLAKAVFE